MWGVNPDTRGINPNVRGINRDEKRKEYNSHNIKPIKKVGKDDFSDNQRTKKKRYQK